MSVLISNTEAVAEISAAVLLALALVAVPVIAVVTAL